MRDELKAALEREEFAHGEYDDAVEHRKKIVTQYFGMRYDVRPGEEVLLRGGRVVKLIEFVMVTNYEGNRPGIIGVKKLPFGWSKDEKEYGPEEWITLDEDRES